MSILPVTLAPTGRTAACGIGMMAADALAAAEFMLFLGRLCPSVTAGLVQKAMARCSKVTAANADAIDTGVEEVRGERAGLGAWSHGLGRTSYCKENERR